MLALPRLLSDRIWATIAFSSVNRLCNSLAMKADKGELEAVGAGIWLGGYMISSWVVSEWSSALGVTKSS